MAAASHHCAHDRIAYVELTERSFAELSREQLLRRARDRQLLRPDRAGTIAHEVLAALLADETELTPGNARSALAEHRRRDLALVYTLAIRQRVIAAVCAYDRFFRRDDEWAFLGAEVFVDDVRLDLIWVDDDGNLEADELKTGVQAAFFIATHLEQARLQLAAGRVIFGDRFRAVRLCLLASPEASRRVGWGSAGE